MDKSPNKQARINEIASDIAKGHQRESLMQKFKKKWGVSENTVDRYIADARKIAHEAPQLKKKAADDAMYQYSKDVALNDLMNEHEAKMILASIARGELTAEKIVFVKGEAKKIQCKPEHKDMIAAIASLSKKEGWDKNIIINRNEPDIDLSKLSDAELKKWQELLKKSAL